MSEESWVTIAVAIAGSGLLNTIVTRLLSNRDKNTSTLASIKESVDGISKRLEEHIAMDDERDAIQCRARIQRFNDELLHGEQHTKEHFDSVILDITRYDAYCDCPEHKDFANGVTKAAERNIQATYDRCLEKHTFL